MRIGNVDVPGHDLLVTGALKIKATDLGGATSGSDRAHQGFKPKTLQVGVKIRFIDAADLTRLVQLAEQLDSAQKPRVYNIVDTTAAAMNIRQVQFTETFRAREDESLKQWHVSFELAEYRSVPEKVEQRQTSAAAQTQQAAGTTVTGDASTTPTAEQLTSFEKVLEKLDKVLAPDEAQQST